jgi:hypothetical protein
VSGIAAELVLEDFVIADGVEDPSDGYGGGGIVVQFGAAAALSRGQVVDTREAGVRVLHEGSSLSASGLRVAGTAVRACAEPDTPLTPCPIDGGDGIMALGGVSVALEDFMVVDNARVGVHAVGFSLSPTVSGERGSVTGNSIGINLRADTVSPSDFRRVVCKDNVDAEDGCFGTTDIQVPPLDALVAEVIPQSGDDADAE